MASFLKLPLNYMIHHIQASIGFVILLSVSGHLQHLALLPNDHSLISTCDRLRTTWRGTLMDAF